MSLPEGRLAAHAKPPGQMRDWYKQFQKKDATALERTGDIIDFSTTTSHLEHLVQPHRVSVSSESRRRAFCDFARQPTDVKQPTSEVQMFEVRSLPGLFILPSLLPPEVQLQLLEYLFHRDLSNPEHKTNIHTHYHVLYPSNSTGKLNESYFGSAAADLVFQPKDPSVHKPLSTRQFLERKLRWITLGGQYDWTNKTYPEDQPPGFPPDIKDLIEAIFPMRAEAAIVNLYSPGDTLSLHRDVSEQCDQPLVSISLGCDAIFIVGLEGEGDGQGKCEAIRLRSGDAVLMSCESRFAWHGIPKVLGGTCPSWMQRWPAQSTGSNDSYSQWNDWMKDKRINLNVRQMFP